MARTSSGTRIVRFGAPRAVAPIIKVSAPRASPKKRRGPRRRSSSSLASTPGVADAIGGFLVGFAVKQGWVNKLPAIPVVGRTGTAALLLGYWARHGGGEYVKRSATAAAVLAGYTLGSTGAIMGGDHLMTAGRLQSAGDDETEGDDDDD